MVFLSPDSWCIPGALATIIMFDYGSSKRCACILAGIFQYL